MTSISLTYNNDIHDIPSQILKTVSDCILQLFFRLQYVWLHVHSYIGLIPNCNGQLKEPFILFHRVDLYSHQQIIWQKQLINQSFKHGMLLITQDDGRCEYFQANDVVLLESFNTTGKLFGKVTHLVSPLQGWQRAIVYLIGWWKPFVTFRCWWSAMKYAIESGNVADIGVMM